MIKLTLKQFRYFEALVRHGHFGRAAEACAISQPALSMQIKTFEEDLGAELFERGGRQVRLTGFGEEIAQRIGSIVRSVEELEDYARALRRGQLRRLRIGVIPTVAPYLLPDLIGSLTRLHEGVDIRVRETLTPKLIEELGEGRLDLAVIALPLSEPSLVEFPLFTESFVLVRPSGDRDRPPSSPDELRTDRLLLLEEGHCFREQALSFCAGGPRGAQPRDVLDASSLSTLVQMVGAGMGVTLIPEMAIPVETRSAPVSVIRFVDPQPTRTIGMVWRRTSSLGKQLSLIAEEVRRAAASE